MKDFQGAALDLRAKLGNLTECLAAEIAALPSQRTPSAISALWEEIDAQRTTLNRYLRELQDIRRQPRQTLDRRQKKAQKERRDLADQIKREIRLWHEMEELVRRHADPPAIQLFQDRPLEASDSLLSHIYQALHKLANPNAQSEAAEELGCFADIPMTIQGFELMMNAAYRVRLIMGGTQNLRFLDVGCGGGTKVFAATRYFRYCDGLEYDPAYAEAARRSLQLLGQEDTRIHQGDGLTWEGYNAYDIIYFYRPMREDALLERLERQIIGTARPGTIILAPYNLFLEPRADLDCARVDGCLFVTGISQDDADAIKREAERTARRIRERSEEFIKDAGIWAPICASATQTGDIAAA